MKTVQFPFAAKIKKISKYLYRIKNTNSFIIP